VIESSRDEGARAEKEHIRLRQIEADPPYELLARR
jgi:hypothetical protein